MSEPRISADEVRHVASLSRLNFSEEELVAMTSELDQILDTVSEMMTVPIEGLEATLGVGGTANRFREDVVAATLPRSEALSNAPCQRDGLFEIPRILSKRTLD